jgi:hypothetical protein
MVTSSGGRMPWQNAFLQIALVEGATLFDRHQNRKPKRVATKNRSEAVAFAPNTVFVVVKLVILLEVD